MSRCNDSFFIDNLDSELHSTNCILKNVTEFLYKAILHDIYQKENRNGCSTRRKKNNFTKRLLTRNRKKKTIYL